MREINSVENLNEFVVEIVNKSFITDVSPLFVVACENPHHKYIQKSIGYSAALAGADVVLLNCAAASAHSQFESLFADGIFTLLSTPRGIFIEAELHTGEKETVFMDCRYKKTGIIYNNYIQGLK